MKLVLQYIYIQFIIAKNHKLDLVLSIINFVVTQVTSFIFIDIINGFSNIEWTYNELLFLHGFSTVVISLDSFLFANIATLEQKVNHGNFDIFLIKPQSVLFQIIFEKNSVSDLFCAAFGVLYIVISASSLEFNILFLFIGFAMSLAIIFFVKLLIVSTTFWTNSSFTIYVTLQNLLSFGKYPITLFTYGMQVILVSIVPIGLVSSIPVMVILYKLSPIWFVYMFVVLVLFSSMAIFTWKKGLEKYQSPGN